MFLSGDKFAEKQSDLPSASQASVPLSGDLTINGNLPLIVCVSASLDLARDLVDWCGAFAEFAVAHTHVDLVGSYSGNPAVAAVVMDLSQISFEDIRSVRGRLVSYLRDFPSAHIIALVQKKIFDNVEELNVRKTDQRLTLLKYPISPAAFQVALSKSISQHDFADRISVGADVVSQLVGQVETEVTRMLGLMHELSASQAINSVLRPHAIQSRLSIQRLATLNRAKRVILEEFGNDPYWSIIVELYLSELLNKPSDFKGVALKLGIPLATFTRRIEQMTAGEIVEREIDSVDKRRHRLRLTASVRRQVDLLLDN